MKKQVCASLAVAAAAVMAALPAQANQVYGFDADTQGWTVQDGGTPIYRNSGGNSGGNLEISDANGGEFHAVAPGSALGDLSSYVGGTLSFDVRNVNGESADWAPFGTVSFANGGNVVSFDAASAANPLPDGAWRTFSVALTTAVFGAQLPSVLAHVTDWRIDLESHAGVSETVAVDNIRLVSAVPEPGSWALMLAGVGAMGLVGRRRAGFTRRDAV